MNKIKTSVIIPVYNTEKYLDACVESVLAQTQQEIEIILVDDGSTDGSRRIIEKYEKTYSFVKAVFQENQKLGAARNAGVKIASGEYIYFLDSDDYVREDLFEKCYQEARQNDLDFVMFDAKAFVEDIDELRDGCADEAEVYDRSNIGIDTKIYTGIEFWNRYFTCHGIYSNAYLVYLSADFFRHNELYFEAGVFYEDMDWIVRVYECAERITYIPYKMYYRRIHAGSIMTVSYNDIHMRSCIFICKKMIEMLINEEKMSKQDMILPVLSEIFRRFCEIFQIYCQEKRVDSVWEDLISFYEYLVSRHSSVGEKSKDFQGKILLAIERIKAESGKSEMPIDLPDIDVLECKRQIVSAEVQEIPLNEKGKIIGIYGTGLVCDRFLAVYKSFVDEISAAVFFIDTYKESGSSYQGYPLYNIKDLADMNVDGIIIASSRYKEELQHNIAEYCPKETKVFFVPDLVNMLFE